MHFFLKGMPNLYTKILEYFSIAKDLSFLFNPSKVLSTVELCAPGEDMVPLGPREADAPRSVCCWHVKVFGIQ